MKKKTLFIGSIPPPAHGVTIQNQRLLNSRLKDEFEIIHLDTTDLRDLNNLGKLDFGNVYLAVKHLIKQIYLLIFRRPDLVYLTVAQNSLAFFRDGLFIISAKLFSNAKVIIHFRGGNYLRFYEKSNFIFRKFIDVVYSISNGCIVLGEKLKSMVSGWFSAEQIFVVPNGSDFSPNFPCKPALNTRSLNIGYLGILSPEKGITELISAFRIISQKYPQVNLSIAGDFAYQNEKFKTEFFNSIRKDDLENRVLYLGKISGEEKENFFIDTDIFILPSWMEGHPNVILEAMASGCPVVASNVGAISESIIDGYNGFLVNRKSVQELVEKITVLVSNPQKAYEMGINSRKFFEEKFTSELNIDKMIDVFETVGNNKFKSAH